LGSNPLLCMWKPYHWPYTIELDLGVLACWSCLLLCLEKEKRKRFKWMFNHRSFLVASIIITLTSMTKSCCVVMTIWSSFTTRTHCNKKKCIKKISWAHKTHSRDTNPMRQFNLHPWNYQPNIIIISWCYYPIKTKFNILMWISNWHIPGSF
jgi:hypothetical protein